MATASNKRKEKILINPTQWTMDVKAEEINDMLKSLDLCNTDGIKDTPQWNMIDRKNSTYFLLPPKLYRTNLINLWITSGTLRPNAADFERFWFRLSDMHKERRLLTNYFAIENHVHKMDQLKTPEKKVLISTIGNAIVKFRSSMIGQECVESFRGIALPNFVEAYSTMFVDEKSVLGIGYTCIDEFRRLSRKMKDPAYIWDLTMVFIQSFFSFTFNDWSIRIFAGCRRICRICDITYRSMCSKIEFRRNINESRTIYQNAGCGRATLE